MERWDSVEEDVGKMIFLERNWASWPHLRLSEIVSLRGNGLRHNLVYALKY